MKIKYMIAVGLILLLSGTLHAASQRGALILYKEALFEYGGGVSSSCEGLYDIQAGRDVPDMRDFRHYFCEGRYTVTLEGKKGTTLSLFGQFKYKKAAGFMVVVKNDDQRIWLNNLEDFPLRKMGELSGESEFGSVSNLLQVDVAV